MARAVVGTLAGVVFLRVLGVSLVLPGFLHYGESLGGTTFEAGLAFGAYPLALALFMLPLGALSDRVGRRPVIVGALAVSAAGGILAAFAPDVWLLAAARLVQGAGAVNAVAIAVLAEVGAPEQRTQRMAIVGAAAGIGFAAGLVLGAALLPTLGIPGLLIAHSIATLALLPALVRVVPAGIPPFHERAPPPPISVAWLGLGGLALNLSLTGLLFLSPRLLATAAPEVSYVVALLVMVLPGGVGMFLAARLADRGHARAVGLGAALLLGLGPLAFLGAPPFWLVLGAGILFFAGHSSLSSLLPSLAAHVAGGRGGRTQGILSTLQYAGSAVGSAVAGALYPSAGGLAALFLAAGGIVAVGILAASRRTIDTKAF